MEIFLLVFQAVLVRIRIGAGDQIVEKIVDGKVASFPLREGRGGGRRLGDENGRGGGVGGCEARSGGKPRVVDEIENTGYRRPIEDCKGAAGWRYGVVREDGNDGAAKRSGSGGGLKLVRFPVSDLDLQDGG